MNVGAEPVARKRRRHLNAIAIGAVAVGSALLAGCGGGTASSSAGAGAVAAFVPAGVPVYFELSTQVDGSQWQQTIALAKRFPGYEKAIGEVVQEMQKDGVDFEADLKPLLGESGAIALTDFEVKRDADPHALGVVDIVDGKEADLLALLQKGKDPIKKVGEHAGVTLYGDSEATAAITDGMFLIADTKEGVTKAIDAHAAGDSQTMAGSDKLKQALADLPDEVLAQGFVDIGAFVRLAGDQGGAEVAKQLADAGLGADSTVAVSVAAEADGVRVKAVANKLGPGAANEEFSPKLLERVPADAVAYVGLKNLYKAGETGLTQKGAQDPEFKKGLDQARGALALVGLTLDDIKGLTSGEHAVVVTKGASVPGVALALEVPDGAKAQTTLDTVREKAVALAGTNAGIPPFAKVQLGNGVTGWGSQIKPEAGIFYGVDGNTALIGTQADAIKQIQAPTSRLVDDPAYQAATRQMPAKVTSIMWINGETLLTTLDSVGALKDAPDDAVANLRPLKNLAAWTTGGDKMTIEAFLTIK